MRACFTFLGEGYYGETDPEDAALYRLDIHVTEAHAADDLLAHASNKIADALSTGQDSIKGCTDALSWLPRQR